MVPLGVLENKKGTPQVLTDNPEDSSAGPGTTGGRGGAKRRDPHPSRGLPSAALPSLDLAAPSHFSSQPQQNYHLERPGRRCARPGASVVSAPCPALRTHTQLILPLANHRSGQQGCSKPRAAGCQRPDNNCVSPRLRRQWRGWGVGGASPCTLDSSLVPPQPFLVVPTGRQAGRQSPARLWGGAPPLTGSLLHLLRKRGRPGGF